MHMSGRQNESDGSVASKVYSTFVDEILEGMNPQGGDEVEEVTILSPPRKRQNQRRTPPRMTYSAAAQGESVEKPQRKRKNKVKETKSTSPIDEEGLPDSSEDSGGSTGLRKQETLVDRLQTRLDQLQEKFKNAYGSPLATETSVKSLCINNNDMMTLNLLTPADFMRNLSGHHSQNQSSNKRKNFTKARRNTEQRGPGKNTLANYFPRLVKDVGDGNNGRILLQSMV